MKNGGVCSIMQLHYTIIYSRHGNISAQPTHNMINRPSMMLCVDRLHPLLVRVENHLSKTFNGKVLGLLSDTFAGCYASFQHLICILIINFAGKLVEDRICAAG